MPNKKETITISRLAELLGISRVAVLKKLKKEEIKMIDAGNNFKVELEDLPKDYKERLEKEQKEATKKLFENNGKDIEFEKELWKTADKLRGSIDASQYKHIVLGLLFLKYVSDAFYQRREQLKKWTSDSKNKKYYIKDEKNRKAIIDNKDYYKSENIFYIPKNARWNYLRNHASHPDIGKKIDDALDAIEKENEKLKGVLNKIFTSAPIESYIIGELINIISKIKFDHDLEREKDMLGRVYEYFLAQFASAEGKRGGEFYTPKSIVRLLVEVLEPFENTRIFDPSCGSGGMFVQSREFLRMHKKDSSKISFFGQESNKNTLNLCKMNLAVRGISGDIQYGNSYYADKFPDLRADFCLANPPFNADWDPKRLSDNDPRIKYGTPLASNANFMWIQHFIHHLAPNGMAGFVMANGALAVGGKEGEIRKKIIEDDLIDVIIACPAKMFFSVALPVSLWFVSKNKTNGRFRNRENETLFIDAREIFEPLSRKQVIFTDEHMKKISDTVRAWRNAENAGKYEDVAGFCKSVKKEEIAKNGYVLTPGRYVGIAEEEDDGVPFEEKMKKIEKELKEYFKEGEKLEGEILKNLKKIKN